MHQDPSNKQGGHGMYMALQQCLMRRPQVPNNSLLKYPRRILAAGSVGIVYTQHLPVTHQHMMKCKELACIRPSITAR